MIVVADAGPLIALARIGQLALLPSLYGEVRIPEAARDEVVARGADRAGADEVRNASWVRTESVHDSLAVDLLRDRLGAGESEAIVLAIEARADLLLMDEERGRRLAASRGLTVLGTLGVLILSKRGGLLDQVAPHLDALLASGFRMDEELHHTALQLAGEAVT